MPLQRKKSRKIKVNGISYLWIANSNGDRINVTISPEEQGQKILANFDFDTEDIGSNAFNKPFIVTPYVTREVILYAIKKGYSSTTTRKEMNLGNLSKIIKLDLSGARKTKKLIKDIERRIDLDNHGIKNKETVQSILNETNHSIKYNEWYVGFENMLTNFDEINFRLTSAELFLVKEIFQKAKVDWKKEWDWIDNLKERN